MHVKALYFNMLLVSVGVSGCSSKNEPSEANFEKALAPMVANLPCAVLPKPNADNWVREFGPVKPEGFYPLTAAIGYGYNFGSREWVQGGVFRGDPSAEDTYTRLVELGALRREDAPIQYEDAEVPYVGLTKRPKHLAYFYPTDEAKALFTQIDAKVYSNRPPEAVPALCYGGGKVLSVDNFTIPGDGAVQTSQVTFTWGVDPINAAAQAIHDADIPLVDQPPLGGSQTVIFTLTNEGWMLSS